MSHRRCFTVVWRSVRFAMLVVCLPGMLASRLTAQDADALDESVLRAPSFDMDEPQNGLVLWSSEIGSSAGPISFHTGNVFVGTTNSRAVRNKKEKDCGVLACFRGSNGHLLWEVSHDRLPLRITDLPGQAIKSKLTFEGDRGYYVSNRGELVCLDVEVPIGIEASLEILTVETREKPDNARWWFYLGQTYEGLGEHANAVEAYRQCWGQNGWAEEAAWACYKAAMCLRQLGQLREAVEVCAIGLAKDASFPELTWHAGFCCYQLGRYSDALCWCQMAIALGAFEGTNAGHARIGFRDLTGWFEGPYDVLRFT